MSLVEAINQIRPSVVQLCFLATELSTELQQRVGAPFITKIPGTGFFVNPQAYVMTARHVIQKGRELVEAMRAHAKGAAMSVGLCLPNSETFRGNRVLVGFDLIDEDENFDLALLRLKSNPFQGEVHSGFRIGENEVPIPVEAPQLNPNRPEEGQWIGISGYPFEEPVLVTNSGHVASAWTTRNYLADVEVNPGNSGGPVYLVEDSSIIGVCVASRGSPIWHKGGEVARILDQELYYSSGLTHIIPTRYIVEILDRNELDYSAIANQS